MPSDETILLFALILIFYVAEGVWRASPGTVAFGGMSLPMLARRLRVVFPRGSDVAGFGSSPLGPGSFVFATAPWPVLPGPDGILLPPPSSGVFSGRLGAPFSTLSYAEASRIQVSGRQLRLAGRRLGTASSTPAAARAIGFLRELAVLDGAVRRARIQEELEAGADVSRVEEEAKGFVRGSRDVAVLSSLALVHVLVVFPLLAWAYGLPATWPLLIGVQAAIAAACAWRFLVRYRRFYPEDGASTAWQKAAQILLFPPSTPHALEVLSMPYLDAYHPLVVGAALLRGGSRARFLREYGPPWLLGPASGASGPESSAGDVMHSQWEALRRGLEKAGISLDPVFSPPDREHDADSYCPCCWAQYRGKPESCSDCPEVILERFRETDAARSLPS